MGNKILLVSHCFFAYIVCMNYYQIYRNIIEKAKNRSIDSYTETHHIIPKCMGGSNNKDNLVKLTPKEHFICHKLLHEIYPNENGLVFAYWMMAKVKSTNQDRKIRLTSREYEELKIKYSRVLKQRTPWNKGLNSSDSRVEKYSQSKRWNMGLSKRNDDRLSILSEKQRSDRKKHFKEKYERDIIQILELQKKGFNVKEICRIMNFSKTAYYQRISKINKNKGIL